MDSEGTKSQNLFSVTQEYPIELLIIERAALEASTGIIWDSNNILVEKTLISKLLDMIIEEVQPRIGTLNYMGIALRQFTIPNSLY